jgi:hypothetical protein
LEYRNSQRRKKFALTKLVSACALACACSQVMAGGFSLYGEANGRNAGDFAAGAAAEAADASTLYYNPAGLVELDGSQIVIAGTLVHAKAKLDNNGTLVYTPAPFPASTLSLANLRSSSTEAIPALFYAKSIEHKIAWGVGVFVPFGLATDWGEQSNARYAATRSALQIIDVSPAFAAKLNDQWNIGAGLDMQFAKVDINSVGGIPTPFYIPIKLAIFSSAGQPYDIQQELIILNEEKHTYEFHDIEDGAVVSLLRDFSAPVSLSFNQKDDDLRLLIEFETDGFARFEAMYKLQKRVLHELLKQADRGEQLQFNSDMAELYTKLLQQSDMDMALKAELLQPLSFEEIVSELKQIDVAQVMSVRDFYLDNLAEHCREEMLSHYLSLAASADNSGARKLKNVLLSYLSRDSKNIKLLKQQFEQANNMTDEIAALSLIVNQGAEVADDAITAFYNKWSSQELVLDKWFTVQASADNPEVIQAVTSLMAHSDFHLSNPNKVRALISGFAMGNPRYFHTEAGYQILTDVICKLDKVNPQTAARLVTPLTRWQRYHPTLQLLMKTALTQILSVENLSKDVFEVVSKSLDVSESAA